MTVKDAAQLVQSCAKSRKMAVVLDETIITTQDFINQCATPFEYLMLEKATKVSLLLSLYLEKYS